MNSYIKPKVLVVEDEEQQAQMVARLLEATGRYEAIAVTSGQAGFKALEEDQALDGDNHIALILLDIKMPRMDGLQFLEKLRQQHDDQDIGVMMLTAYEDADKWERATSHYIYDYIKKPIVEEKLISSVDRFFSSEEERSQMKLETFAQLGFKRKYYGKS